MHAPVRNTTFAALVTAGLFAVGPAAHADTVSDDRGPVVGGNEWEPLINAPINVCGDSIAVLRRSAVCSDSTSPARIDEERSAPPAESVAEAPDRCGAGEHCPVQETGQAPEAGQDERSDGADDAAAEPEQADGPGWATEAGEPQPPYEEGVSAGGWDTASGLPEAAPAPNLSELPRVPEPAGYPQVPESATYALTATGSQDAPLLTAGVATVLLGGVAIYVGYGLGRSDRPNLFR